MIIIAIVIIGSFVGVTTILYTSIKLYEEHEKNG